MQPLQYDLRDPAAQESSIAHAAAVPRNLHAAITMRCAASRRKPARIYAHGNTRWQQPCSHSTAICNHRFKTRIELRTQEQPLVAEHRGGNQFAHETTRDAPAAHTRYLSSPPAATLHLNTRFRAPASSPKQSPCNIHAAIPMRSATTASRNTKNYAHRNNHSLQNT